RPLQIVPYCFFTIRKPATRAESRSQRSSKIFRLRWASWPGNWDCNSPLRHANERCRQRPRDRGAAPGGLFQSSLDPSCRYCGDRGGCHHGAGPDSTAALVSQLRRHSRTVGCSQLSERAFEPVVPDGWVGRSVCRAPRSIASSPTAPVSGSALFWIVPDRAGFGLLSSCAGQPAPVVGPPSNDNRDGGNCLFPTARSSEERRPVDSACAIDDRPRRGLAVVVE